MLRWNETYYGYTDKEKLPSGQTIEIIFQEFFCSGTYYFNICLETYHKRKQRDNLFNKQTGKDGLQGLIWAKKKILEFEEYVRQMESKYRAVIYCTWTDNQRRNVYEWGLKKIGYEIKYISEGESLGFKALCKTIEGSKE
jgi:hypothetical protein